MRFCKIIFFLFILSSCSKSDSDILIVGTSADYPPFEFTKDGNIVGFDIDIINEVARELDMKVEINDMDFSALIPALNNEQIDLAISSLTITEERKENVDFSDIYYQGYYGVVTKSEKITDESQFENKKIGVQLGSVWENLINSKKDNIDNIEVIALPRINILIEELKLGRIDAVIIDEEQAYNYAINSNLNYHIFYELGGGLAIALKKDSTLTDKVNQALKNVKANKIQEIKKKWFRQ